MTDAIASWWKEFELQAPHIDALFGRREEWDLVDWMNRHLGAIHPQLMWEFGPAVNCDGNRLVITPEARRDLRPLVREILTRAPSVDGWEFYEYRLPEDFEQADRTVNGRAGGSMQGVRVLARQGAFNRIDLTYSFPVSDVDEESAQNIAFVATEALLGEETLDRWIGAIEVSAQAAAEPEIVDIGDLPAKVQRLIAEIQGSLPDRPWHQADEGILWTSFTCTRQEAEEYAGQDDLFVGVTVYLPMWQNALAEGPFDSVRYSRCGEQFCYLKIDGIDGLEHSDFIDRREIEDAINESLRPSGLGSVVGGGTGLRYSYIEMALTDVEQAWQQMGVLLSNARLPKRTWLLFHDTDLSAQWHGLYEDTPNPPMPERD